MKTIFSPLTLWRQRSKISGAQITASAVSLIAALFFFPSSLSAQTTNYVIVINQPQEITWEHGAQLFYSGFTSSLPLAIGLAGMWAVMLILKRFPGSRDNE